MKKFTVLASAVFLTGALAACNANDNEALDTRYNNDTRPIGYYSNENMDRGDRGDRGEGPITQIADRDGDRDLINNRDNDNANINYADNYNGGDLAQRIAKRVNKINNVDDARVIVNNDTVVVGVDTNDQNNGNAQEKVRNVVQKMTDKNVQVTTDEDMYTRIRDVDNNLRNGDGFDEVRSDFTGILNDLGNAAKRPFENNR